MKIYLSLLLVFVCFSNELLAQLKVKEIVESSRSFYTNIKTASYSVNTTFKSSIAEAYTIDSFDIVYCKHTKTFMHTGDDMIRKWSQETGSNLFYKPSTREYLDLTNDAGARESLLDDEKAYPFYNPSKFFAKIHSLLYKVVKKDSYYVIFNSAENYYFDTTTYELKQFDSYYDFKEEGIQIKKWEVVKTVVDSTCSAFFDEKKLTTLNGFKQVTAFQKPTNNNVFIGQRLSKVPGISRLFSNDNLWQQMKGKYVLIDFFYQSCMPCVASFPLLKNLHEKYKTNLKVIGVNPFVNESSTMNAFIKRYQLPYNIISGENGNAIKNMLHPEGGYPYFILIDKQGKIIDMSFGYDEGLGDKIDKIIANDP